MKAHLKIDGTAIKLPHTFKIERYNLTNSTRLANGDMSMELVAKKRKFYCTWLGISGRDMNKILELVWETSKVFFTLEFVEDNVIKTAVCYTGSIPKTLHRTGGEWVWKEVSINFIER